MTDLNALSIADFYLWAAETGLVQRVCVLARDEDLGSGAGAGDVTSQVCVPAGTRATGAIVARQNGVVSGLAVLPDLAAAFGVVVDITVDVPDGSAVVAGTTLATISGSKRDVLTLERSALNFVGRLSGVATKTAEFVGALNASGPVRARLYDIRKTTPGLRVLEKYAVRCGGGMCHRMGLFDAVLIKDNHIAGVGLDDLAGVVSEAARRARSQYPGLQFVEVEVESLEQLARILAIPPRLVDIVLLDNMSLEDMRRAVEMRDASASKPALEASGGVRLETLGKIAATGVERISAGTLTHGSVWMDVALDMLS